MTRVLEIESCLQCPNKGHKGGHGHIAFIPVCYAKGRELPYTVGARGVATLFNVIPEWCPLLAKEHTK